MLGFFPIIYKNELLYSVFARYHTRSGNRYEKHTFLDLFGKNFVRPYADIPRKISRVIKNISHTRNVNFTEWVNKYTLYFYFSNFAKEHTKNELLTKIGRAHV